MEHRQCCSQPQSLCCKTSSAQQKWRQRGGAGKSVISPESEKKGEGECSVCLCEFPCMCACVRERAQTSRNRVWVLAKLRDDSLKQKQNNITLSADGIFPNTLIKNHRGKRKRGVRQSGSKGEKQRDGRREGGRGESQPEAPWNLNKTITHRKQKPQNSNRKLAPDSEYQHKPEPRKTRLRCTTLRKLL